MPKSATFTPRRQLALREQARHLDPEAVVGEEDVADAGDQDALGRRVRRAPEQLDFLGREEEAVPGLARTPEVAPRVVLEHHGDWTPPSRSCWTTRRPRPAVERAVEDVAGAARVQAHEASRARRGPPRTSTVRGARPSSPSTSRGTASIARSRRPFRRSSRAFARAGA
jgi:hypothetical protein